MTHNAYTRHTYVELQSQREETLAPLLREHHRRRIDLQIADARKLMDNVRYRLFEISDLMDETGGEDGLKVNFRELLRVLKAAEVNLDAAVGRLAGELGLVSCEA